VDINLPATPSPKFGEGVKGSIAKLLKPVYTQNTSVALLIFTALLNIEHGRPIHGLIWDIA
jgi:hypothetical protein